MAQLRIPTMLRPAVGGERSVAANGTNVREAIERVDSRHPGFASQLMDGSTGELRPFVNVYVNDEDVRYLQGLATPLDDDDVISVLPAVAGGGR